MPKLLLAAAPQKAILSDYTDLPLEYMNGTSTSLPSKASSWVFN